MGTALLAFSQAEASLCLQRLNTHTSPGSKGWAGVKNRRRVPSVPNAGPASFPPCWLSDAGTPGPCPPARARRPVPTITTATGAEDEEHGAQGRSCWGSQA